MARQKPARRARARDADQSRRETLWCRGGHPRDGHQLEFLTDNGGAYIATDTRAIARSLGLKPVTTPVCSPQSNGMAESVVNTFKRDYVSRKHLADAGTVMARLPGAFEHFNNVHPHSSLRMRSPREVRQHQRVAQTGLASTSA